MADLTARARRNLPGSVFAGPDRSFPIPDRAHAEAALMDDKGKPPAEKAKIDARAHAMLSGALKSRGAK